jgi:hypothetical protein
MAILAETKAITTVPVKIFEATNPGTGLLIKNVDATLAVYVGGSTVTAADGFPLAAGESVSLDLNAGTVVWVVSAGSSNIKIIHTHG